MPASKGVGTHSYGSPIVTGDGRVAFKDEIPELTRYLRRRFNNDAVKIVIHPKKTDMAEVFVGEEFLATLYRDEEDGEVSWQFQMAILDVDLEEV